ncbi:MAG: GtrA family protein [Acidimicrobiales bacterium]
MSPGTSSRLERAREFRHTPAFAKLWRYAAVSVISTVLTEVLLYLFFRVAKVGSAAESNALAAGIATVPSYYLNRTWAWGKTGKSHVMREVVPFWTIAAVSLVLSTIAVGAADGAAKADLHSHSLETLVVLGANIGTYGVIWVAKFVLFNKVLFVPDPAAVTGPGTD